MKGFSDTDSICWIIRRPDCNYSVKTLYETRLERLGYHFWSIVQKDFETSRNFEKNKKRGNLAIALSDPFLRSKDAFFNFIGPSLGKMARVKVKFLHDLLKTLKIKENPTLMNIISLIFLKFCDDFFSSDDLFDLFEFKIDDEDLKILHHKRPNSKLLTKLVKIRKIEGDMLYFAVQYNHKLLKRKFYFTIINTQFLAQKNNPRGVCFAVRGNFHEKALQRLQN